MTYILIGSITLGLHSTNSGSTWTTCQRLNIEDRTSDTMFRLIQSLLLSRQPILACNAAWPSDLDLAISELSLRRYTNAVVTSQIKARSYSLGLDPEPTRVGHGISCIDYCCLAKPPTTIVDNLEPLTPEDIGADQFPQTLKNAHHDSVYEQYIRPQATQRARQSSVSELSTLRKLSISDKDSETSAPIRSPKVVVESSIQETALGTKDSSPQTRLQRSHTKSGRLERNDTCSPNLVMPPATLLECLFEERLEEGVEELTKKSNDFQTATPSTIPSLIHSRRSSIPQDRGWIASQDHLTPWIDPLLAMFGRAYGV